MPRRPLRWALAAVLMSLVIAPASRATDPDTIVHFVTPLGAFDVEMFPDDAPITVANFLKYVTDGDFDNSFIHRSVPGFIIQGGGFTFQNGATAPVPADPPIVNEFGRSNLRGTIAMAKVGGDPNSATSQWFINLANNSANLDNQNGGFTVFGQVTGNGMAVVDALAAVPTFNAGGAFTALPLINFTVGNPVRMENLLTTAISIAGDAAPVTPSLLLRRSTNHSWFSYRLSFDNSRATIEQKGAVKLSRNAALETVSRSDFDGDGEPDALLRDTTLARAGGWQLATLVGKKITSQGSVDVNLGADWDVVSTDDFNGDGKADLLLRNSADGRWVLYLLESRSITAQGELALSTDLTDTLIGVADFDGDGRSDVLLRRANRSWLMYLLDGLEAPKMGQPKLTRSARSGVEALADFDGDGRTDVLTRSTDGSWLMYLLDGARVLSKGATAMSNDTDLALLSDADFSGDGKADALLRGTDGSWILYALDGRTILTQGAVAMSSDTGFRIVSTADFNLDGKADVLLRHSAGNWMLYALDGAGPTVLGSTVPKLSKKKSWVLQNP